MVADFSVGVDGKVCLEYNNTIIRCILQPTSKLSVTFSGGDASNALESNEIILVFFLQSIVVQDHLDEIICRFIVSNTNNDIFILSAICDNKLTSITKDAVSSDLTSVYGMHDILVVL